MAEVDAVEVAKRHDRKRMRPQRFEIPDYLHFCLFARQTLHYRPRGWRLGRIAMVVEQFLQCEAGIDAILDVDECLRLAEQRRAREASAREAHHEIVELQNRLVEVLGRAVMVAASVVGLSKLIERVGGEIFGWLAQGRLGIPAL